MRIREVFRWSCIFRNPKAVTDWAREDSGSLQIWRLSSFFRSWWSSVQPATRLGSSPGFLSQEMVLIKTVDVRNGETVVGSVMNWLLILIEFSMIFYLVSWFCLKIKYKNRDNLQIMNGWMNEIDHWCDTQSIMILIFTFKH